MYNNFYVKYNYNNIIPFNLKKKILRVHASIIASDKFNISLKGPIKIWFHYFGINGLKINSRILGKKFLNKKLGVFFISNLNMIEGKWALSKIYQEYYRQNNMKKKKKYNLMKGGFILNNNYLNFYKLVFNNIKLLKDKNLLNIMYSIYIFNMFKIINLNFFLKEIEFFKLKKKYNLPIVFIKKIKKKRFLKKEKKKYFRKKYYGSYNSIGFLNTYKKRNILKIIMNLMYLEKKKKVNLIKNLFWKAGTSLNLRGKEKKKKSLKSFKRKGFKRKLKRKLVYKKIRYQARNISNPKNLKKNLKKIKKEIIAQIKKDFYLKKKRKDFKKFYLKNFYLKKKRKDLKSFYLKKKKYLEKKRLKKKKLLEKKLLEEKLLKKKRLRKKKRWKKKKRWNILASEKPWLGWKYKKFSKQYEIINDRKFFFKKIFIAKFFVIKKVLAVIQLIKILKELKQYKYNNMCFWFYKHFINYKFIKFMNFIKKEKKKNKNLKIEILNNLQKKKEKQRKLNKKKNKKIRDKWRLNWFCSRVTNIKLKNWLKYLYFNINKNEKKKKSYNIFISKWKNIVNSVFINKIHTKKKLFINNFFFVWKKNIKYNYLNDIWWKYSNYSKIRRLKIVKKDKNKKNKRWFRNKFWFKQNSKTILQYKNIRNMLQNTEKLEFIGGKIEKNNKKWIV